MAQRQFRFDDTSPWPERYGNRSDGALVIGSNSTFNTNDSSCSGSSGSNILTLTSPSGFANGNLILIHQSRGTGAGGWELNRIVSGAGTTTLTLAYPLTASYLTSGNSIAQAQSIPQYSSITINSGQTWSAPPWNPSLSFPSGIIAVLCDGDTIINGTIDLTGAANAANSGVFSWNGAGGFGGGPRHTNSQHAFQGEGAPGVGVQDSTAANGQGGGSGGGTGNTVGGGGGHATSGQNGNGNGGGTAGVPNLTTMLFGGGAGGSGDNGGFAGIAGNGGAILLLITKNLIINPTTGLIKTNGGNGVTQNATGGSGGAGGSALIKGQTINLGTNRVTAIGGIGSAGSGGASGVNGGDGRIHVDYSKSLSGTTTPTLNSSIDPILADKRGGSFLYNIT